MSMYSKQSFLFDLRECLSADFDDQEISLIVTKILTVTDSYDMEFIKKNAPSDYRMYLNCFIDAKKIEGRSEKTLNRYSYILTKFFNKVNLPVESITIFHMRNYFANEKQRGLCDKTLNGMRDVFNSFFGWLQKEGMITLNPCANLGMIKCVQKIRMPFSDVEIERLKEHCSSTRDKAIICFLLSTGCRISEVCALNKDDIDFNRLECVVLGKGNKERTVYFDEVTAMLLKRYFDERKDKSDALFVGKGTNRMQPSGIRSQLHKIGKKANVENVHPHRFRRTLATNLIDHGMSIQEVATILGHEKIDTTTTYIYVNIENVKNAYKKFAF